MQIIVSHVQVDVQRNSVITGGARRRINPILQSTCLMTSSQSFFIQQQSLVNVHLIISFHIKDAPLVFNLTT